MKIANKYAGLARESGICDIEDIKQAGMIGLLEAQRCFDPQHENASFMSYSMRCIISAIVSQFGYQDPDRYRPKLPPVYLDQPLADETDDSLLDTVEDPDILPFDEPIIEEETRAETAEAVHAAVDRLKNTKQREAIRRVYFDGQTKSEAAAAMGIQPKAFYNVEREARDKLRTDLRLKEYAIPFFHIGVNRFNTTWTSATEAAVLWRLGELYKPEVVDS